MSRALSPLYLSMIGLSTAVALVSCGGSDAADSGSGGSGNGGADSGSDADAASDNDSGTGGSANPGSGGGGNASCANQNPTLAVTLLDTFMLGSMGTPFDTDGSDLNGPRSWAAQYGKAPEIMPHVAADGLSVLFQDQADGTHAYVVHIAQSGANYAVDAAFQVESLGRIMGLTRDAAGNYYVASGVDEDKLITDAFPPNDIHRPDIVRIVKFDASGCVLMESDVDMERAKLDEGSSIIVNPIVAATSRLVWGADRLLLVHGYNTAPDLSYEADDNGNHPRHQKAMETHINALDGSATRVSTMWVSHSFDQRALFDGTGFVELHLGDAYPRAIALGRYNDTVGAGEYKPFHIKGDVGANNTMTRLGGIVQSADATYGYMALIATERTSTVGELVNGTRDLALTRIRSDFASQSKIDESVVEEGAGTSELAVTVHSVEDGAPVQRDKTNHVRWLTDLGPDTHAERPRIVAIGGGQFVVLFERWSSAAKDDSFGGTYALLLDESGGVVTAATKLDGDHHIGRGDDIVAWGGKAVYVTGGGGSLWLNVVDPALSVSRVQLP